MMALGPNLLVFTAYLSCQHDKKCINFSKTTIYNFKKIENRRSIAKAKFSKCFFTVIAHKYAIYY